MIVSTMWDDGLVSDFKLIEILQNLEVTACFAIAPCKHKNNRLCNDIRGHYGTLVSRSELKEFEAFEICNHTANHVDLGKITPEQTRKEIIQGRQELEQIFNRAINGFCYPYGIHTSAAINVLKEEETIYARTTLTSVNYEDNLLLHPTGRWDQIDVEGLIRRSVEKVVFWGHTYELSSQMDWDRVKNIYQTFKEHPEIKIVSFKEMASK